jgi:hypothetical protein
MLVDIGVLDFGFGAVGKLVWGFLLAVGKQEWELVLVWQVIGKRAQVLELLEVDKQESELVLVRLEVDKQEWELALV